MLKGYRFWFGTAFGYASSYFMDPAWPSWASVVVWLSMFFVVQYFVHKIAES